jgi:hypothetical protein
LVNLIDENSFFAQNCDSKLVTFIDENSFLHKTVTENWFEGGDQKSSLNGESSSRSKHAQKLRLKLVLLYYIRLV